MHMTAFKPSEMLAGANLSLFPAATVLEAPQAVYMLTYKLGQLCVGGWPADYIMLTPAAVLTGRCSCRRKSRQIVSQMLIQSLR